MRLEESLSSCWHCAFQIVKFCQKHFIKYGPNRGNQQPLDNGHRRGKKKTKHNVMKQGCHNNKFITYCSFNICRGFIIRTGKHWYNTQNDTFNLSKKKTFTFPVTLEKSENFIDLMIEENTTCVASMFQSKTNDNIRNTVNVSNLTTTL